MLSEWTERLSAGPTGPVLAREVTAFPRRLRCPAVSPLADCGAPVQRRPADTIPVLRPLQTAAGCSPPALARIPRDGRRTSRLAGRPAQSGALSTNGRTTARTRSTSAFVSDRGDVVQRLRRRRHRRPRTIPAARYCEARQRPRWRSGRTPVPAPPHADAGFHSRPWSCRCCGDVSKQTEPRPQQAARHARRWSGAPDQLQAVERRAGLPPCRRWPGFRCRCRSTSRPRCELERRCAPPLLRHRVTRADWLAISASACADSRFQQTQCDDDRSR